MDPFFLPIGPRVWSGRYTRVPGNASVYHVRYHAGAWRIVLDWTRGQDTATCPARPFSMDDSMVQSICAVKCNDGGGSFQINEYGQVLVPEEVVGNPRWWVGSLVGTIEFDNPFRPTEPFSLCPPIDLPCGAVWDLPYVGMPYNLSGRSNIYCKSDSNVGEGVVWPTEYDADLVRALRVVRPWGEARFLVNCHGAVLTKRQEGHFWNPVYVGRINKDKWFEREGF